MGSNLPSHVGDCAATICSALAAVAALPRTTLLRASSLHITKAVSTIPQPDFVNAAAILSTSLPPGELLDALLTIEHTHGRERPHPNPHPNQASDQSRSGSAIQAWHARPLDLDLIIYSDLIIKQHGLTIPHPRLHLRRFVLAPLAQIAPDLLVPTLKRTVRELLQALPPE